MSFIRSIFSKLFRKKTSVWTNTDFGKPSTAGDDFRKSNDV